MIKKIFIAILRFFGLEVINTKKDSTTNNSLAKVKDVFLFSSKLSNELLYDSVIANCEFADYLKVSDRFSVHPPEGNIFWKDKQYKIAILKDAKNQLSLSNDGKRVHGSLVVIYNKEETWVQRMDNDPTRELSYLLSIKENNKHEFYDKLEQDYFPIRPSHELQKHKNLSLFIHIYKFLK